ncbi:hypothetical protein ACUN0C_18150 [Faunimonas sp. B44]
MGLQQVSGGMRPRFLLTEPGPRVHIAAMNGETGTPLAAIICGIIIIG